MKKITILAPLMLVPLLLACGGSKQKKLTKEEFDHANSLVDIETMQVDLSMGYVMTMDISTNDKLEMAYSIDEKNEMAPSINHYTSSLTYQDPGEEPETETEERYSELSDDLSDDMCYYIEKDESGKWGEKKEGEVEVFYRVPTDYAPLNYFAAGGDMTITPEMTYENFKFNGSIYTFTGTITVQPQYAFNEEDPVFEMPVTIKSSYKDKKLSKMTLKAKTEESVGGIDMEMNGELNYAYDDITPVWPAA